jgi:tetratricopeptide (TPR) repeat protein
MESPVEETPAPVVQTPAPQPAPVVQVPAPQPIVSPAPMVNVPAAADVSAALNEARRKASAGEIDSALVSYEAVVRANSNLDVVVANLSKMLNDEKLKKNPAIYRVLGDGLMRQGELQQALDTYRKALNLL